MISCFQQQKQKQQPMNQYIVNPITNRKVSTTGTAYKKAVVAFQNDNNLLYNLKISCETFATNYLILEKYLPPYQQNKLGFVFTFVKINDNSSQIVYENMTNRFKSGRMIYDEPSVGKEGLKNSSLFKREDLDGINNECYLSTLDTLDNWSELKPWRLVHTEDGYAFDLYFIVKLITNQLNEIKSGNPYPVRPFNPFTGAAFSQEFLIYLKERLEVNKVGVSKVLTVVLNLFALGDCNTWNHYDQVALFESEQLRYVKDFDVQLTGYWADSTTPLTFVEEIIIPMLDITFQITNTTSIDMYTEPFLQPNSYFFSG